MKKRLSVIAAFLLIMVNALCAKDFVVVIDAGHGGKDPGAIGKSIQEKDINLSIAKMVGQSIAASYSDVKVVYTRSKDVFVTLPDRASIANKADGDLFISIHTNASESKAACGTETFTLGLAKTSANFEVAKRENSVMMLENDKEVYQDFDPTSPDSYIMFELMQGTYIDQSVMIADFVQKEFVTKKRQDRGVRQAGFWVLHQVKMPSVLIEVGFVTNGDEEKFLGNAENQQMMADCIVKAFGKYKHEYDKRNGKIEKKEEPKDEQNAEQKTDKKQEDKKQKDTEKNDNKKEQKNNSQTVTSDGPVYRVQCFAVASILPDNDINIKKLKQLGEYGYIYEGGYYKYFLGGFATEIDARDTLKKAKEVFKDAFLKKVKIKKK